LAIKVNGQTYFRTADVCRLVGISRTTLFRWLNEDMLSTYRQPRPTGLAAFHRG